MTAPQWPQFVRPAKPAEPDPAPLAPDAPKPLGYVVLNSRADGDLFASLAGVDCRKMVGLEAWAVPITFRAVQALPAWIGRYQLRESL